MTDPACAVGGCIRPVWAKGWCGTHYRRWRRTGSTDDPAPRTRQFETYAEYDQARRHRDPEGYRAERTAHNATYRERNRDKIVRANAERRNRLENHPDPTIAAAHRRAHYARNAVYEAVKAGKLVRPDTCEQCGKGGTIEAAHHDYAQPYAVRWLCQPCHRRWDAIQPKTR